MNKLMCIGFLLFSFSSVKVAFSDQVRLTSGKIIEGGIIEQTDEKIKTVSEFDVLNVPMRYVAQIGSAKQWPTKFENPPQVYTEKINQFPDFVQRTLGPSFCVPAAVSNGFLWLDDYGFDNITKTRIIVKRTICSLRYY